MHLNHPPPCPPTCDHCLAYDNLARALCSRKPSPNSKWCSVHEELQAKLLKTYKRYTFAVESFDNSSLPKHTDAIFGEGDLAQLRTWSETSRQKWSLVRRVIAARAEHHQQFYAGGDWGHCLFVETLKEESLLLERFLRALDCQAYKITLANSAASWILTTPAAPSFVCDDEVSPSAPTAKLTMSSAIVDRGLLTPPPTPPLAKQNLPPSLPSNSPPTASPPVALSKTRRKAARRKAARQNSTSTSGNPVPSSPSSDDTFFAVAAPPSPASPAELLARLRAYLEPPSDLPSSIKPQTWRTFTTNLFRHVVLRIPALANLAFAGASGVDCAEGETSRRKSVEAFLDYLEERIEASEESTAEEGKNEVEELWRGLKFAKKASSEEETDPSAREEEFDGLLGVGVLADEVANLCRPILDESCDRDESVELLGGRVWRAAYAGEWPRESWDLLYQFIACPGCSLVATRRLSTWATNRRLAALGHYPAWLSPCDGHSGSTEKIFRLSGIVLCTTNSCKAGRKVKRVESKEKTVKGKGGRGKKTVYVEEWERAWMYVKLPLDEPRSQLLLDALSSLPSRFAVLARKTAGNEVTHRPSEIEEGCASRVGARRCTCCNAGDLWLNKVRSGLTPIERKAARWTISTHFPLDTVLSSLLRSSSPETRFHAAPYSDSVECLILDASPYSSVTHDRFAAFAESVAQAVLAAQGCQTVVELATREREAAVRRGEMSEGEWERMCVVAEEDREKKGKDGKVKKVVYVCEEGMTARGLFREEV
ncbi:hypothetical protein JCM1841_003586 [Sporobolomyces salmonicolor]